MQADLALTGGRIWDGERAIQQTLYIRRGRIVHPCASATKTVNLSGYVLFPGLINSHDHLELNHYPRTRFRDYYSNAHDWGEDCSRNLEDEPFRTLRSFPLSDRLFIGALKNLLSGVCLVVHHNPLHHVLRSPRFPLRVFQKYGWAHSLHFETTESLKRSYTQRKSGEPWIIHLAEGTDARAANEYEVLEQAELVSRDTVLVHGVGLSQRQIERAAAHTRGLIACPTTNAYLLNAAPPLKAWMKAEGEAALGSDSRLTASGDILDEMRAALHLGMQTYEVIRLVTTRPARLFHLRDSGHLQPGAYADVIAVAESDDPAHALCDVARRDLAFVMLNGTLVIANPELRQRFGWQRSTPVLLDEQERFLDISLAQKSGKSTLKETGLIVLDNPRRKWYWSLHG